MAIFFLLATLASSQSPSQASAVEVQMLSGATVAGSLLTVTAQEVAVETPQGRAALAWNKLAAVIVKHRQQSPAEKPTVWIELVDGSVLYGISYASGEGRSKIALPGGLALEISNQDIKKVRFQSQNPAVADQWTRLGEKETPADLLVMRKDENLDYHAGAIRGVTEEAVQIDLDGDIVRVKRAKVHGLVYHHSAGRQLPEAVCSITDVSGSSWMAKSVTGSAAAIEWITPAGVTVSRPLASIVRLDFALGNVLYLSDLKPDSVEWIPFFGLGKELPTRMEFYSPKMDRSRNGGPLEVNGKKYAKGLCIHSRTTIVYRLRGRFGRFKAVAGIDQKLRGLGNVQLVIRGDDKVLVDVAIAGNTAKTLDLDVAGVRRLTILVDFGGNMDLGDDLDLCDARFEK